MATKNNWYALTGGPGSGKTTLIEELNKLGHNTVKESARLHIENQLLVGLSIEQIRADEKAFQEAVFRQKQIIHEALSTDVVTFFDRGFHDTVAYLKHHEHKIEKFIEDICKGALYKKVFVLDMLPYKKDAARIEDRTTAQALHAALIDAYRESAHEVIRVPVLPPAKRAQFVLSHI